MQGGKSSKSRRYRRKQCLSYSCTSPWAVDSFLNDQIATWLFSLFIIHSLG